MLDKRKIIEEVKTKAEIVKIFLGYKKRTAPPIIEKKIKEEMETFGSLIEIEYEYCLKREKNNSEDLIYCIYTIGDNLDKKVNEYLEMNQSTRALILDKIGVVTLDIIKKNIKKEILSKYNLNIKREIYAGNRNEPMSIQKDILNEMKNIKTIKVNEYYQLFPIKTVALKFLLTEEKNVEDCNICEECDNPCELYGIKI